MNRATAAAVIVAGALAGVATAFVFMRAQPAPPVLERATLFEAARPLPAIALQDQTDQAFDLARMRGHWTLLFFGFTNCPDVCPTTLATLAGARRQLADLPPEELPEVVLVTVDPARDTPAVVKDYVRHFSDGIVGLTGTPEEIAAVARAYRVYFKLNGDPAKDSSYTVDHSALIYVMDREGRFVGTFTHETPVENAVRLVRKAL